MALQHLEHHHSTASYPGGGLDGYTSYSSDSSAPRTPSPREESGSYPAVFTPEMHNQPWAPPAGAGGEYQYNPQEGREYESKAPTGPPSANGQQPNGQDHPGAGPRRNTFPSVQYDREDRYGPPPPSSYQLPPPGSAPMYAGEHEHNHHYPPPPSSGSPHPPYHEYDHYGRPPPPPHHYYAPPPHHPHAHPHAHMGMPPHPMSHHPHLGMTYISPHTGLPVQHTDDAASKETQYLRRRCFNCHTTEPPSWRRSTLNPGKIVCNKCGLYERTHLRPRPLRFDELRAGNKARKAQPGGAAGGTKKKGVQSPPPPPATAPAANGSLPPLDEGKGEPRDYNLVRRSSVGSSGSSSTGNSDWDSTYPSNPSSAPTSHPNTTYSSPATQSYPLPQRTDSHSPQPDNGIRLPSASLTSSPLIQHASISPHLSSSSHLGGSPQMLHHTLHGRSPPRKSHTYPTGPAMYGSRELNGSNHSLVGESPPA